MVHGDGFSLLGAEPDPNWRKDIMQQEYEVKIRCLLGPEPKDYKMIRMFNKCLDWRKGAVYYEADPRHAEIVVSKLGLAASNFVVTSSVKENKEGGGALLPPEQAKDIANSLPDATLALDRCGIQFAIKSGPRHAKTRKIRL